jgi:hypothetical protein
MNENQIVIYQTEDGQTQIDVRLENETVWLIEAIAIAMNFNPEGGTDYCADNSFSSPK